MSYGGLRAARWLRSFRQAPLVTAFRNLESGQVVFSQTLHPQQFYLDQQFKRPNWQNRKPLLRRDMWRAMAVAELPSWDLAVQLYKNLVQLRDQRDLHARKQALAWRRKNDDGNTWFWNQYRPTYAQEAVADLLSALEAIAPTPDRAAVVHWEHLYRRGAEELWRDVHVQHEEIRPYNVREQGAMLNAIRVAALKRAQEVARADAERRSAEDAERRAQGLPTHDEVEQQKAAERAARVAKLREARRAKYDALLAQRPDLRELRARADAVREAARALGQATKAFDNQTPKGQRGLARQPIKLCAMALRLAKRSFRQLKHEIEGSAQKRPAKIPQRKERLQLNERRL